MTILVWVTSAVGALLFTAVGVFAAKLLRPKPEPPVAPPEGAPSGAEIARLRLEMEGLERQKRVAEEGQKRAEIGQRQAEERLETERREQVSRDSRANLDAGDSQQAISRLERELDAAKQELGLSKGEQERDRQDWRRREAELEATLESLSKERDSAYQQAAELERVLGQGDDEPTNLDISPAQFTLLKDQLGKAESRERALAGELSELKAQLASGDFGAPAERKPSTLIGMKPPAGEANQDFDGEPLVTREFARPKTLIGLQDPGKLYHQAQVELDLTRAELEKARAEAGFWKKHAEKLTSEAARSRGTSRGRARASVGVKPTASTGPKRRED